MTTTQAVQVAEALRRAAVRAMLAPSVRNSQPWRLVLTETSVEVHADWSRRLRVADPRGRQVLISCGCAIFNARVALSRAGYESGLTVSPDGREPDRQARLTPGLASAQSGSLSALDSAIELRHTNRSVFSDEAVPVELVAELRVAARSEGAELFWLDTAARRSIVARLGERARGYAAADPAFRLEMRAWGSGDGRRFDGVPSAGAARDVGPDSEELLMALAELAVLGWSPERASRRHPECLLLLGTVNDTPADWVAAGQALERVLLELTGQGYVAHPMSQITEVAAVNASLREELGLRMHPHILLRIGRAAPARASRRRRLADVIEISD